MGREGSSSEYYEEAEWRAGLGGVERVLGLEEQSQLSLASRFTAVQKKVQPLVLAELEKEKLVIAAKEAEQKLHLVEQD